MLTLGAWGTLLYDNDTTNDIRGYYVDQLRRGRTNEEVTQQIINDNMEILEDVEEGPLFWYALADIQWDYGRLIPFVKEKALEFIERPEELERWKDMEGDKALQWEQTRIELRKKLLSPQPPIKKITAYRLYKCKWQLGDVFAYQFHEEYSKKHGVYGQYIIFRKVEEDILWPGHIVPSVQVYWWIGSELPTLEKIKTMPLLPQKFWPVAYTRNPEKEKEFLLNLQVSRENAIPKEYLTYLGNISGNDLVACRGMDYYTGYARTEWKNFEIKILDQYNAWTCEK